MEYDAQKEARLAEAFHMMWDAYPEGVRLIRRDFFVIAANPRYMETGGQISVRCIETGDPSLHKGCLAQACLRDGEAKTKETDVNGITWVSYWLPVKGAQDYFVHFTDGINASIAQAMAAMRQAEGSEG